LSVLNTKFQFLEAAPFPSAFSETPIVKLSPSWSRFLFFKSNPILSPVVGLLVKNICDPNPKVHLSCDVSAKLRMQCGWIWWRHFHRWNQD